MVALLRRYVVMVNKTEHVVELKEYRRCSPPGIYPHTIQLDPFDDEKIPATMFHKWAMDASRPTIIKIFLDDVYSNKALTPQDLIDYSRISFRVNETGELIVSGERATRLSEQLCRIRFVHFLIRGMRFLMGDNDRAGDEGQECESEIKAVARG